VAVQCGAAPGADAFAGIVQPLILSKPLCSAHQLAAAFSASARVGAVNSLQYLALFGTIGSPVSQPRAHATKLRHLLKARQPPDRSSLGISRNLLGDALALLSPEQYAAVHNMLDDESKPYRSPAVRRVKLLKPRERPLEGGMLQFLENLFTITAPPAHAT
jgi:hypothetical protein